MASEILDANERYDNLAVEQTIMSLFSKVASYEDEWKDDESVWVLKQPIEITVKRKSNL